MSYDFGQKRIESGSNEERNGGTYIKTILGESIGDIPVPVWTADKSRSPFVAFQDPKTQKIFGISREMLAYGLLSIGAPGTGKTNFFNMILERMLATMQQSNATSKAFPRGVSLWNIMTRNFSRNASLCMAFCQSLRMRFMNF